MKNHPSFLRSLAAVFHVLLCTCLAAFADANGGPGLLVELERKWPENRTIHLVFHGHSVPAGYHVTPEVKPFDSYPHLVAVRLKERFPHAVINTIVTAIGGENSVAGAARFERDVLIHRPDILFIDYALNDRRLPMEEVEQAWRGMITAARERGIPVVLLTPTDDTRADWSHAEDPLVLRAGMIRKLAADLQLPVADVSAAWLRELAKGTEREALLSQVNHPNRRGHDLAADTIFACLAELLGMGESRAPSSDD